ncbi:conjugal transfer protein TrbL [Vibrio anguillarum]|nr:conjugal transfer protein TrbL [Vibrio anguillarum]
MADFFVFGLAIFCSVWQRQAHAEWQERDPEKHTFDVEEYVSYAQARQQERNEEVASFVKKGRMA